ncbi:YjbF family lipoprotein [Jannaschia seohaensis]|uniref:Group 4 capsule polysaccharide lipoprotein GfcB/YjbF n=1 Tax=Jannaschia seohaensis TaxID=475081 RepID=A0A2Y9C1Y1_9RHOB|nr:YjbF family lipoprotein [Jannaschia seohaensis]PWJ16515.1 group 4 capsule polysaccharide lipoprotein GfcB/YjbF [Jannaschia seohaensis]SSA48752.1 Group 4 capsule polysaccharide lipoprotein gfcB, YjbF [Jannaschia seohaensis]
MTLTRWSRPFAALLLAALAACSGGTENAPPANDKLLFAALQSRFAGLAGEEPAADAREVLTPAMVAGSPTPLLLVVVQETDIGLTMVPRAVKLGTEQWRDISGGGLFRRNGILVGTRGFGFDLHTADVAPLAAALRAGGGEDVERVNRYIDGQNQIVAVQFLCSVRPVGQERLSYFGVNIDTTVYEEDCVSDGGGFVNRYWLDAGGTVRRSVELIAPESGSLDVIVLKV